MIQRKIELDRDEAKFVYVQLSARKEHFEKLMMSSAQRNVKDRVLEIARVLEKIDSILEKLI